MLLNGGSDREVVVMRRRGVFSLVTEYSHWNQWERGSMIA